MVEEVGGAIEAALLEDISVREASKSISRTSSEYQKRMAA
jgi:hypothetical protein